MRLDTFIRKALRLKAHRVVTIEEDEAAQALVVHLDRRAHRRLHSGECGRAALGIAPTRRPERRWRDLALREHVIVLVYAPCRVRCPQHCCSAASGNTAVSAPQVPRWPSPITSFGATRPRALRSRKIAAPALGRLPIAALHRQDHLLAVAQRRQDDEHRGLLLLEPGLHVHAVHPEVDDVERRHGARLPELVLGLPSRP